MMPQAFSEVLCFSQRLAGMMLNVDMTLKVGEIFIADLVSCWLCQYDFYSTCYSPTVITIILLSYVFRVKAQTAIFEEMIEDEEGLVDDRIPTTNRGLWAISETERSMKALLSFAKSHRFDVEFIDEGSTSMDLFEAWKKEYKVQYFKLPSNIKSSPLHSF